VVIFEIIDVDWAEDGDDWDAGEYEERPDNNDAFEDDDELQLSNPERENGVHRDDDEEADEEADEEEDEGELSVDDERGIFCGEFMCIL
jgi:hypothetical protein